MIRIDLLLSEKKIVKSRTLASKFISEGRVTVNGKRVTKPSELFDENTCDIKIEMPEEMYVSRGGLKLSGAVNEFRIPVSGKICIDIGASTGGFTDFLLQNGAKKVYAVDSGSMQLDEKLRNDKKVVCMENTNARYLGKSDFADEITLAVMDVSFISQTLIYPAISDILPKGGVLISLIKPQFELTKTDIGKNGIVKDKDGKLIKKILSAIDAEAEKNGLKRCNFTVSPITGGDGNTEYLACFVKE